MRTFRVQIRSRWIAAGIAAVLAAYLAQAFYYRIYVNDDAYITLRYSRFLAMGYGPYFNHGEHVEGYTNFLLMLIMAPVIAIGGEAAAPIVAKAIGVLCGGATVLLTFMLAGSVGCSAGIGSRWAGIAGLVAAGIVAASPAFALNCVSGLETSLFAACILAALYLGSGSGQGTSYVGVGLMFAAAVLTRPEGIFLFAMYWCSRMVVPTTDPEDEDASTAQGELDIPANRDRLMRPWIGVGVFILVVYLGHIAYRIHAYDGQLLPNTYYAKRGGFWKIGAWTYIADGALMPCLGWVAALLGCVGWALRGRRGRKVIAITAVGVGGSLLPFVTGTDWMLGWRLVVPYLPIIAVLIAVGWCRLAHRLFQKPRWLGTSLILCTLPASWFIQADFREAFHSRIELRARGYANGHTALANWLRNEAADSGDAIALMDIGIVGYMCIEQRILDISGLTNRSIAQSPGPFLDKDYDVSYVLGQQPEFIVLTMTGTSQTTHTSDGELDLEPWTRVEKRILQHPSFQRHYLRQPKWSAQRTLLAGESQAAANTTAGIAERLGAEHVFQHDYPGRYYLLAVFRRHQ